MAARVTAAPSGTDILDLFNQAKVKEAIVKPPIGLLKHEYLVPAGPYDQLFDWDMYFMSVALSYDQMGRPVAGSVQDFLEFVDSNANNEGYTPREIAKDGLWALPEMCKPFLAQAALRASQTMNDFEWLRPSYEKLTHTVSFWERTRRARDGFFRWYDGVESGTDNNPAVSDDPGDVTEGVDLQCYIYREYLALSILADRLGKTEDAAAYRGKAEKLKEKVQKEMWSEPDGTFFNIDANTGKSVRIKTWTNFTPLWAGVATPAQAKLMIEKHLLNPKEFWAPHGVRTIAADEPLYAPKDGYWRGPVWVISNYMMMHGLMNYGYGKDAVELADKTVAMLAADLRATGGMNECYNPETGAPTAGGNFVSWNLLAGHMSEEARQGTDPAQIK